MSSGTLHGADATAEVLLPFGASLVVPVGDVVMDTLSFTAAGDLTIAAGRTFTQNGGAFHWAGGTLAGTGVLTMAAGAQFDLAGNGVRVLDGLTINVANLTLPAGSLTLNSGTLNAAGTTSIASGALFTATGGAFNGGGGNIEVDGIFQAGAGTVAAGTMHVDTGGLLRGTGTINGTIISDGIVAAGTSPGQLVISGDYTQNALGVLQVELAGITPGTQYDWLDIGGSANLDGTLEIDILGGFAPQLSDVFTIVTAAGGVTSEFGATDSPPGFAATPDYLAQQVDLRLAAIAPPPPPPPPITPPVVSPPLPQAPRTGSTVIENSVTDSLQRDMWAALERSASQIRKTAFTDSTNGPLAGTVIAYNPPRPPGSSIQTATSTDASPREYKPRAHIENTASEAAEYRNQQENEAEIVYREEDSVREMQRQKNIHPADLAGEVNREANRAAEGAFTDAQARGATFDQAIAAARAAREASRQKWQNDRVVDVLVVSGQIDPSKLRGLTTAEIAKLFAALENAAQLTGLNSGKAATNSIDPKKLESLIENIRKGRLDVDGLASAIVSDAFENETGVSLERFANNVSHEVKAGNFFGGQGAGSTQSGSASAISNAMQGNSQTGNANQLGGAGTGVAQGSLRGDGRTVSPESNTGSNGGNASTSGSGSTNTTAGRTGSGSTGNQNTGTGSADSAGSSMHGAGSSMHGAGSPSAPTGAQGAGDAGGTPLPPGNYVSKVTNADGSFTLTSFTITPDGRFVDGGSQTYRPDPNNPGEFTSEAGKASGDPLPDGTYTLTEGQQNEDGTTDLVLGPVKTGGSGNGSNSGQGNSGGQQGQENKEDEGEGSGDQECTGDSCQEAPEEDTEDTAAEDAEEPSETGRPNPMSDDPVDTMREMLIDLVLNQGKGTRQQLAAIDIAAGGDVTNPGDAPDDTGAGGTTSPNLDIKLIGVKSGGGVDGGRNPEIPEFVGNANLHYIELMIGGGVTDPPREAEPAPPAGTPPIDGDPIGPVEPAAREVTQHSSVNAATSAVTIETIENIQIMKK